MHKYFVELKESRDEGLFVAQAHDVQGRFLGVVSEETREEALDALKGLVLEMLLEFAAQGENPLQSVFRDAPKHGLELYLADLFPATLRYRRFQKGLTQSEVAAQMGQAQQVYARLERPGVNPTLATVQRLGAILGTDILAYA
ncbi:helix-turn-helix domain-containing protein [Holophaga foetida]|uniref:helix-turn-helix domain-containing protein n=1 Tax=Holophaga foetida TaxID=35839 RepID=UPI00024749E6|nr:helix-turn-helix transcriptional regulator [Holophaga foetida]